MIEIAVKRKDVNSLAPIGISTYIRIDHLRQTVNALLKNELADQSVVYFFSDAPQEGHERQVAQVREYIRTVKGFSEVVLIERKSNSRVFNNREGMRSVLQKHGRIIFLEEDIVTAPGFLRYMNESLEFYQHNPKVLSVIGYCPPISIPHDLRSDNFFLKRFSAWGFGTWSHKFDPFGFQISETEVSKVFGSIRLRARFKSRGVDMLDMLKREVRGDIDALDVKVMFSNFLNDTYCSYPTESFVQNIGFDGTGVHCGVTNKFVHEGLCEKIKGFSFSEFVEEDERILKENYKFRARGWRSKLGSVLRYLFK